MPYVLSERFINELERHLASIVHSIDFNMFGEGIQQARQTAADLRGNIYFIRKHPELYLIKPQSSQPQSSAQTEQTRGALPQ